MFNRLQFARVYSIMVFVGDLAISTNIDSQRREIFMNKMEARRKQILFLVYMFGLLILYGRL
jgi:hypothetical protein